MIEIIFQIQLSDSTTSFLEQLFKVDILLDALIKCSFVYFSIQSKHININRATHSQNYWIFVQIFLMIITVIKYVHPSIYKRCVLYNTNDLHHTHILKIISVIRNQYVYMFHHLNSEYVIHSFFYMYTHTLIMYITYL